VHLSEIEVEPRHRQDIFTNGGISHQISLVVRTGGEEYLKMSFCRSKSSPQFGSREVESWAEYSDLLTALFFEHSKRLPAQRSGRDAARGFSDRLRIDHPSLTERERAVCSLIAVGMTSTGIALTLGISVNTVLTFRRRAYARLNITSHGELLRLVL
jgi:DNA-binding CsgD family transcriptional regulator